MIAFRFAHLYGGGFVARPWRSRDTTAVLGDVLARCHSDGRLDVRLNAILAQWATEARTAGMKPERMVIALKELWFARAEHDPKRENDGTGYTLLGVLRTALTAYFADTNGKAAKAANPRHLSG